MRLALAQTNPTVGALEANAAAIARQIDEARRAGAHLVVFPELALTGYPPRDLLLQPSFVERTVAVARRLGETATAGITAVFGVPLPIDPAPARPTGPLANSLLVYGDNRLVTHYDKRLLPSYDVFDEDRYFTPGDRPVIIEVAGVRVGLSICEDLWRGHDAGFGHRYDGAADPVAELVSPPGTGKGAGKGAGAQVIINPSASPFVLGKGRRHREILVGHARKHGVYVAAVNQVGGNDELVFDGHAVVIGPDGRTVAAAPGFKEHLLVCDVPAGAAAAAEVSDPLLAAGDDRLLWDALVLGVRDYARKSGFRSAVLGLSGGIDSALVVVLAAAALGPAGVLGVAMPSPYSSQGSRDDAAEVARRLGVEFMTIPIDGAFACLLDALAPAFAGRSADTAEENLQSRLRGTILMALSNKLGHILLSTGNKSELAVGYCTLYGDMNGGLSVISDLTKQQVYGLARWINGHWAELGIAGLKGAPIPEASIFKPPSAELRPNQTDQDSLPPYEELDAIIDAFVNRRLSAREISSELPRVEPATIARVLRLITVNEYKRRQAAPGLKVASVAFGTGRRMPLAQGWRPELDL